MPEIRSPSGTLNPYKPRVMIDGSVRIANAFEWVIIFWWGSYVFATKSK